MKIEHRHFGDGRGQVLPAWFTYVTGDFRHVYMLFLPVNDDEKKNGATETCDGQQVIEGKKRKETTVLAAGHKMAMDMLKVLSWCVQWCGHARRWSYEKTAPKTQCVHEKGTAGSWWLNSPR